jgi:hypothetical protein
MIKKPSKGLAENPPYKMMINRANETEEKQTK